MVGLTNDSTRQMFEGMLVGFFLGSKKVVMLVNLDLLYFDVSIKDVSLKHAEESYESDKFWCELPRETRRQSVAQWRFTSEIGLK